MGKEYDEVELPFIQQLQSMGWDYLEGDVDVPDFTERESFKDVLLKGRLREALARVNPDQNGQPWLDESRVSQAVSRLERLGGHSLIENNKVATELLIQGTQVEGPDGKNVTVHYIDFEHPERNDFLVVNQFRVDPPWATGDRGYIVPDIVLFVNGIPLTVVECKRSDLDNPLTEAVDQLLYYSNQRGTEEPEGAEALFHYAQLLVGTCFDTARLGTVGADYRHYLEWKDTHPVPLAEVAEDLDVEALSGQQTLVAGTLRPTHLLDIVRCFALFTEVNGREVKIVPRYQQYRAVHKAIDRLTKGQTKAQHGEHDQRGGIIWHTQGSGKSLTMVFLVRKMRTLPALRRFKIVAVTDRTKLEKQLAETAALTGEPLQRGKKIKKLHQLLREPGAGLVFGMIQKAQPPLNPPRARGGSCGICPHSADHRQSPPRAGGKLPKGEQGGRPPPQRLCRNPAPGGRDPSLAHQHAPRQPDGGAAQLRQDRLYRHAHYRGRQKTHPRDLWPLH